MAGAEGPGPRYEKARPPADPLPALISLNGEWSWGLGSPGLSAPQFRYSAFAPVIITKGIIKDRNGHDGGSKSHCRQPEVFPPNLRPPLLPCVFISRAVVMKNHRLCGFKQQHYRLTILEAEVLDQGVGQARSR